MYVCQTITFESLHVGSSYLHKINFINSGAIDIIRIAYNINGPELMKLFLPFYMCYERWALHVVIKRKFFLHLLVLVFTINEDA